MRDDDFFGGHIKGANNVPSDKFKDESQIDSLITQLSTSKTVIFHCGKSQQRGPFCAREYQQLLEKKGLAGTQEV